MRMQVVHCAEGAAGPGAPSRRRPRRNRSHRHPLSSRRPARRIGIVTLRDPDSSSTLLADRGRAAAATHRSSPPDPPPAPRHPGARPSLPPRGYGCISSRARRARKQLVAQYGDRLICVRYRYGAQRKKRFKTVELLVAERDCEPPRPRFAHDQIVGLRVAFADVAVRDRVKQAGGTWNPERWVWQLSYDRAVALGLKGRIVDEPDWNSR